MPSTQTENTKYVVRQLHQVRVFDSRKAALHWFLDCPGQVDLLLGSTLLMSKGGLWR